MSSENGNGKAKPRNGHAPWKPGESGNPKGNRGALAWHAAAKAWLEDTEAAGQKNRGMEMLRVIWEQAMEGSPKHAALLLDRLWPAVKKHEVSVEQSVAESNAMLDRMRSVLAACKESQNLTRRRNAG